ncbi:MAG: hypothetical protein GC168_15475 [Candidatus Hydrogenedens sp.]|nr:hypothetical protein [Candidatus Hydrogenedens sp.]
MRFFRQSDVPSGPARAEYSNQSWRGFFVITALMAGISGFCLLPKGSNANAGLEAGLSGSIAIFFAILTIQRWRDCSHPMNWLVRDSEEGLYFNLRPAVNRKLAEDYPTVVHFPASSVSGIGKVTEHRRFPDRNTDEKNNIVYLEFRIKGADLEPLADVLHLERRKMPDHGGWLPHRTAEYPIQVVDGHTIRVAWHRLSPDETKALQHFQALYPKLPARKIEYPSFAAADAAGREAILADLWETGHVETAERLMRMHRGVNARQARELLDEFADH